MDALIVLFIILGLGGMIISWLLEAIQFAAFWGVIYALIVVVDRLLKKRKEAKAQIKSNVALPGINRPRSENQLLDMQLRLKNAAAYRIEQQTRLRAKAMANPIYVMVEPSDNERDIRSFVMMDKRYEIIFDGSIGYDADGLNHRFGYYRPQIRKVLDAATCLISYDAEDLLHRLRFNGISFDGYTISVGEDFARYNGSWDHYFNDFKQMSFAQCETFFGLDHTNDLGEQCDHLIEITGKMIQEKQITVKITKE